MLDVSLFSSENASSTHKIGTVDPVKKWLNRPLVEVSSITTLASILFSSSFKIGSMQPFWQAGVLPVPGGATMTIKRLPFSSYDPKSLTVVGPIRALVDASALHNNISLVVPLLFANAESHSRIPSGATSSIGMLT